MHMHMHMRATIRLHMRIPARSRVLAALALVSLTSLGGCASPDMVMAPDATKLVRSADAPPKIDATAGYFIPALDRSAVVRNSNGAGYTPYRDIELGYRAMLSNVFGSVVRIDSATDYYAIKAAGVQYVVEPELNTSLGWSGQMLAPSSTFAVELSSSVRCASGEVVVMRQVVGQSSTTLLESATDQSAAGRRAMGEALTKMQAELSNAKIGSTAQTSCGVNR